MSDSFLNPEDQANLDALKSQLSRLDADIRTATDSIAAEAAALREQRRSTGGRTTGEARSTETALPSLEKEVEAINQQVVSYERLNQLIADRIQLEARAAAAVRKTTDATVTSGTTSAAAGAATAAAVASPPASARNVAATRAAETANQALAISEAEVRDNIMAATVAMTEYDNALLKTGGLSGAALKALGNGTLTLKELGNQVTKTIGKFGGWALAGAAVYGTLGAVNELKQGAIDTQSTLTGLTKFIPVNQDTARQAIIQQGRETATPLNEVGDTAQQFAKVFKNQGDVFTATHVALTASKLDNIDLADSYKYLTAIVQETGIGVGALPGIFDQITAAQDRLGAKVSQVLPAFASSVGAVKTAGGNPSQLLGLESLAIIRTGATGTQVGTAFARGATNFFPTAASRGTLERYGIDPNQGFTEALIEGLKKGQDLQGPQRRELLTAFLGPRFGSRMAGLFNAGPDQIDKFIAGTAAGASSGLANRQLATTISQPNNQLELLKVNLQAIGAELTGSKMTTPFSALLHIVNDLLVGTSDLIHAWNELPDVVKEVGSDVGAVVALMAVARRFNVGGILASSDNRVLQAISPVLSPSPQEALEKQAGQYMEGLSGSITSELQSASVRQMRAALNLAKAQEELAAITEAGVEEGAEFNAATRAVVAAETERAAAEADISFYSRIGSAESLEGYRQELLATGGGGRGTGGGAIILPGATASEAGGGGLAGRLAARQSTLEAQAAAEEALTGETTATTSALLGLNTGLTAASAKLSELAGMAVPAAIGALAVFAAAKSSIDSTEKSGPEGLKAFLAAQTDAQAKAAYNQESLGNPIPIPFFGGHVPNFPGIVSNYLDGRYDQANLLYSQTLGYIHARGTAYQAGTRILNEPGGVYFDEDRGQYKDALDKLKNDPALKLTDRTDYNKLFNDLWTKVNSQAAAGNTGKDPFAMWEKASQDLTNQLEPMMEGISNAAKVFGTTKGNLGELANGYLYAVERFGRNAGDTKAMQALATAQSDLVSAVSKQVQDLENLAQMATTNAGQRTDYQKALGAVSQTERQIRSAAAAAERIPGADVGKIKAAEQQALGLVAQSRQSAIQGLLSLMQSESDVNVSKIGGVGPQADLERAEAQLQGLQNQLGSARSSGADAQTVNELMAKVNQQAVTVLQDRIAYYQQLAQAVTQYQQAGTADPVAQQNIAIAQLRALYSQLSNAGADKITLLGVLGQERSAELTKIADEISAEQASSQEGLAKSNIGQPQQVQLQNAVNAAQQQLDYVLSLPRNQVSPATIAAAYTALYTAQGAMAEFVIQQGEQMISATAALKEGETFDPVKIAEEALEAAKQLLAYDKAHNMPAAQIQQDQAAVADAYKSEKEAQWQKQESTIEYLAATYQITGQQEMDRLKKLLAAMKAAHASYSSIQQVAQELFNLEYNNSGELNLNVGNIHLPSTYEVRSAIAGARGAQRRRTTAGLLQEIRTDVKMNVNIYRDADIRKFTQAINDALGTNLHGLAQAAGLV